MLQAQLHELGDKLSNDEFEGLPDPLPIISRHLALLQESWSRQLSPRDEQGFRLRMSNVGKPLCQLQMAASGAEAKRKSYNFKAQMMIGDAIEALTNIFIEMAQINVTGLNDDVKMDIEGLTIKGTDDIEIDNKVYDIKSCSPAAFDTKWSKGYEGLKADDAFGYIGQLTGYAHAKGKDLGGWIVMNKSTGEVLVVEADATENEKALTVFGLKDTVRAIKDNHKFERLFEPDADKFNGKPTGMKRLGKPCIYCDHVQACWPTAKYMQHPKSKAVKKITKHWLIKDE